MIEAMACGTPVIAFNQGAVPEVMCDAKLASSSKMSSKLFTQWLIFYTTTRGSRVPIPASLLGRGMAAKD